VSTHAKKPPLRIDWTRSPHRLANDRYLRIPAEDGVDLKGHCGSRRRTGQFLGKASYTLNVIGRDTDEDSCAVPEAGICFRPFLPSSRAGAHVQLFRETPRGLGPIGVTIIRGLRVL
jgi:hypothetical protein